MLLGLGVPRLKSSKGPALDLSILSEEAKRSIGQLWRKRARFEQEAAARFIQLGERLASAEAHPEVIRMTQEAGADEARHAVLCNELVVRFGLEPTRTMSFELDEIAPAGLDLRHRVLYEVIALSCITETLSTALISELVARAVDPVVKSHMQEILKDEVRHARIGWAHLSAEHQRGGIKTLGELIPAMLKDTVHEELFSDVPESRHAQILMGYGSLNRTERRRVIGATLEQVIFPGLERFGIDVTAGWSWWSGRGERASSGV